MLARPLRLIYLLSCLAFTTPVLAQEGYPLKGSWIGDWGPTQAQRSRVVLVVDYDGKNATGAVNPGRNEIPLKLVRIDITPGNPNREARGKNTPAKPGPDKVPGFKAHIEAAGKDAKGDPITIVFEGDIQDIGIPTRWIAGKWSQTTAGKTEQGDFKIRRQ